MSLRTLELLESLMAGHKMKPEELDELLADQVSEGLHLEYKHGDVLQKAGKEPQRTIREYTSGFANSVGGVLIVGVDETEWKVTGCSAPGGGDLAEWASDCLVPIASYFSPLPRFQAVEHRDGDVLVAATARSLGLVFCIEEGGPVYYFRFHDKTLEAPEYLVSDLVLGRRQHPHLHIADIRLEIDSAQVRGRYMGQVLKFHLHLIVENKGLLSAQGVRFGIISWIQSNPQRINEHLLSYLEIDRSFVDELMGSVALPGQDFSDALNLRYIRSNRRVPPAIIPPFQIADLDVERCEIPLRVNSEWCQYIWKAALFLMSQGSPPVWYQLNLNIDDRFPIFVKSNESVSHEDSFLEIKRLSGERPVVAWERI